MCKSMCTMRGLFVASMHVHTSGREDQIFADPLFVVHKHAE